MCKLALGTVQFGLDYGIANQSGQMGDVEADKIIKLAYQNDISTLDTAIAYGESEKRLGELGISDFDIVTKLPPIPGGMSDIKAWINDQLQSSLARLGKERIKGLLLHRSHDLLGHLGSELIAVLNDIKKQGLVSQIGVSIYDPEELEKVSNVIKIDLVQAPLNVIDRRLERSGWLARLKREGVEVHTRSVFLQGLLLMERHSIPDKFDRWSNIWNRWHAKLQETGCSPYAACLSYPISLPEVDQVVVGVDSAEQLQMLLKSENCDGEASDWSFMNASDPMLINPSKWSEL